MIWKSCNMAGHNYFFLYRFIGIFCLVPYLFLKWDRSTLLGSDTVLYLSSS